MIELADMEAALCRHPAVFVGPETVAAINCGAGPEGLA
jgi:hypothetical protein